VSIKPTQHTRAIVILQSRPYLRGQCHDERSTDSAYDVAGSTDSGRQSLLLQCSYKSNTMDEADRIDDTGRGNTTPIRVMKRYANKRSVHCHSNHGKNIPRRKGGSTGQIQKPKSAPGKCQRLTKMRLLRHSHHRDQHRSESDRRPHLDVR